MAPNSKFTAVTTGTYNWQFMVSCTIDVVNDEAPIPILILSIVENENVHVVLNTSRPM